MSYTIADVDRMIESIEDEWENSGWGAWKYEEFTRVETELGVIEYVADFGGEGKGDDYWVVVKITDANGDVRHFKRLGWYASYSGGELDGPTVEVKPTERTIVVYEG